MNPEELTAYLHEKIPLTRAMELRVASANAAEFVVCAPLEANHNHLGTAFGGSLSALATVAGYAFIWHELGEASAHVVIRDSLMNFRRPVRSELRAICVPPQREDLESFRLDFARTGKARLKLAVQIGSSSDITAEFLGTYVALR